VIQDQVNWDRLHLLMALRKSWYSDSYVPMGSGVTVQNKQNFLPSGGVAFDITPEVTAYFSYQKTFNPNRSSELTVTGQTLPPQLREQYEVGIHSELLDKKLNVNTSVFTYTTSNSATEDPANPFFYIPGPGQKSTGFEISGTGAVTPTLNIVAGYSYTYVKNADGTPVQGVTRSLANLWMVKTFHIAENQSLDAGIGGNYNDGDLNEDISNYPVINYVAVHRYVLSINAALGYHFGSYNLNFTANDILNRENYAPVVYNQATVQPGRTVRLVLTKTF
jgi:iron complex outermembrane receptor protein